MEKFVEQSSGFKHTLVINRQRFQGFDSGVICANLPRYISMQESSKEITEVKFS